MEKTIDFINVNRERYLDELKAFLAIPSISALPEHRADVMACAEWCASEMRRVGLQNVALKATPGHPIVYGDWLGAPGAPTPTVPDGRISTNTVQVVFRNRAHTNVAKE